MTKRRGLSACAVLLCGVGASIAAPAHQGTPSLGHTDAAAAVSAHADVKAAHHKPLTSVERLRLLEERIAKASVEEAPPLREEAEALRMRGLKGGTRLLIFEAQAAADKHQFQAAEESDTAALALQGDQPMVRRARAAIRAGAGDFDGAVEDLSACLAVDPGDTKALYVLANLELERHQPQIASDVLKLLKQRDPSFPGVVPPLPTMERFQKQVELQLDGQPD
ncbi:tetratricopeptide repeat protein [Neokomagataea anthophila]|uniref:Tetratricopeptide repeat protein n=1 Tax=Neokomagataea anthophila TaxID=2826925 RepID=A0ABS5E8L5_9PROT|nr:tetratricopeptide repeat protein [Neokomagataea anthophila]MBR0560250.1 tetratricopeptide repeat protein [Neokomagataea anthophila]